MTEIESVLIGTAGLAIAAAVSLWLTLRRSRLAPGSIPRVTRLAAATALLQAAHFGEELATHFFVSFPELLALAPWSAEFFVAFNLTWLTIWAVAIAALPGAGMAALFPIWFLALAAVANGVAHPLLALVVFDYFPGLWTSPLVGLAGLLLIRTLAGSTSTFRHQDC